MDNEIAVPIQPAADRYPPPTPDRPATATARSAGRGRTKPEGRVNCAIATAPRTIAIDVTVSRNPENIRANGPESWNRINQPNARPHWSSTRASRPSQRA